MRSIVLRPIYAIDIKSTSSSLQYDTQFIYRNDYILPEIQFIKALMEKKVPAFKECLHLSLVSVTHRSRNYERWISKTSSSVTTHCAFTSRSTLFSSGT